MTHNQLPYEIYAKRNIKDSVFTDLFADKQYTLLLYKALHPEDETVTEDDITIITLDNVLLNQPYNDLGFRVGDRLLIFVEAQSTWSVNIVVRGLEYIVRTIEQHIFETKQNPYSSKPLKIPAPEFFVIYTGEKTDHPSEIRLSKEIFGGHICSVEATAKIISDGKNGDIVSQYVTFAKVFTEQVRLHGKTQKAILETIRICQNKDVLKTYFHSKEKEVVDIMMALFDKERLVDLYGQEKKEEGHKQGLEQGLAEGLEQGLEQGLEKGLTQGSMNAKRHLAMKLAKENWTLSKIAAVLEVDSETVSNWLSENAS